MHESFLTVWKHRIQFESFRSAKTCIVCMVRPGLIKEVLKQKAGFHRHEEQSMKVFSQSKY